MRGFVPVAVRAAAIYLALPLPAGSSGQPGDGPGAFVPLFGLAPDGVCLAPGIATGAVSSYLAFSPLPQSRDRGGMFLWHFPSGRPAPPLAGILPGGARTFLSPPRREDSGRPAALRWNNCSAPALAPATVGYALTLNGLSGPLV